MKLELPGTTEQILELWIYGTKHTTITQHSSNMMTPLVSLATPSLWLLIAEDRLEKAENVKPTRYDYWPKNLFWIVKIVKQ